MHLNDFLSDFQIFYQKIYEIYHSKVDIRTRWKKIAEYINDNNHLMVSIFKALEGNEMNEKMSMDYESPISNIEMRISREMNDVMKVSLIVTYLHHVIYEMLVSNENYVYSLNGMELMAILKKPIMYYVHVNAQPNQYIYFHTFLLLYALESLFNKYFYIGIDYEYTNKKVQMAQLNFEHSCVPKSIIMIINPNDLDPVIMENFIVLILCNRHIKKIFHGSDSLDVPYMFEYIFHNKSDKIIKFTRTMIDTKILCDYYKVNKGDTVAKCSIYDEDPERSAIFYFGLISREQQKKLSELLQSMPLPHDIEWNIKKLPRSQLIYAVSDVLYIKYFYYRIIYMATLDVNTELEKKMIIELYKHVLYELTQFSILEKRGITSLVNRCKEEVDPINNYMIKRPEKVLKLIDIFRIVFVGISTTDPKVELDKLLRVNYYKNIVTILVKKIAYTILSRTCNIYKDRYSKWSDKLDNKYVHEFFAEMKFVRLNKMFREIEYIMEEKLKPFCNFETPLKSNHGMN
ncbi:MAG: hypothetical protein QXW79_00365 [Thermoplasmata archaeon]